MKRNSFVNVFILFLLCAISAFLMTSCPQNDSSSEKTYDTYNIKTEKIFIENSRGTYTLGEVVYPKNFEGQMPLVAIGHGFTGTLNSGGAEELSQRLAARGIATVRVDFNPFMSPSAEAERTNCYTLKTMESDLIDAIKYMVGSYPVDTERMGLYARSMGGRVAMTMANENSGGYDYKALALVAPAGNKDAMIYFMGGTDAWEEMKFEAAYKGFVKFKDLILKPEWFTQFEKYNPCDYGYKFGDKPVLVICNTKDYVVTDETSRQCAAAYKNSRVIEVTTDNYHGYEMSYPDSELKDYLMDSIVEHFRKTL